MGMVHAGQHKDKSTFRIGISGAPGAGKSTFIESFGAHLTSQGHKLAVLAVDPSSNRNGGSILGDKTRMHELSRNMDAYVRPSPTRGALGGVARQTGETVALCEGGGYDIVVVETVGVGQSEVLVDEMVDMFVLLCPPGAGDELQGIKRGIMEMADMVIVTKADGKLKSLARHAKVEIMHGMQLQRPKHPEWKAQVMSCSALEGQRIDKAWEVMCDYKAEMMSSGKWQQQRTRQTDTLMWLQVQEDLRRRLESSDSVKTALAQFRGALHQGEITHREVAERVIDAFVKDVR